MTDVAVLNRRQDRSRAGAGHRQLRTDRTERMEKNTRAILARVWGEEKADTMETEL